MGSLQQALLVGTPAGSSFLPTDIAGLKMWLQGDNAPSGSVATWSDDSGQGNDATQAVGGDQPTKVASVLNGHAVVRFDGTSDRLGHNLDLVGDNTIIVVAKSTAAGSGSNAFIFQANNLGTTLYAIMASEWSGSTNWGTFRGGGFLSSGNSARSAFMVASLVANSGGGVFAMNGTASPHSTAGYYGGDANDRRVIGANAQVGATIDSWFTGDIAELIAYDSALSTADRESVENYLGAKYGISITH